MSDITSGFNIAENIYLRPEFNDMCGFTEDETEESLKAVAAGCGFGKRETDEAPAMMRTYCNGYLFSPQSEGRIFNPTLVI